MKQAFLIVFLFSPCFLSAQNNPFERLKYDKVVAYEFQGEGGLDIETCLSEYPDRKNGEVELPDSIVQQIESILCSDSAYGQSTSACFDPHLGIVYYLNEEVVAAVSICLECNYLESSVFIPSTEQTMIEVSDNFSYPARGFSKETRKGIYDFCLSIGFEKYLKPLESIYDN
jgi:hypothetical protein